VTGDYSHSVNCLFYVKWNEKKNIFITHSAMLNW
jgi:hypothetical protein